jgi:tetratricopeptide (TPR) repeat protein
MPEGELVETPWASDATPSRKWMLILVLGLTAALVPAFLFIRAAALEVTQYHPAVFEGYARQALASKNYGRALELCTGALKSGVNRSDHWGTVYALRAQAYAGMGNYRDALDELEAAAAFWTQRYYYATDEGRAELAALGTDLGLRLVDAENYADAVRAFSAAGIGGGRPVEYLHDLAGKLEAAVQSKLWPDGPLLIIQDFHGPTDNLFRVLAEDQGRTLADSRIDPQKSPSGGPCALVELSESSKEGRSLYGIDAYLPLSEKPFALRVHLRTEPLVELQVALSYWFEAAHRSALTSDPATVSLPDGSRRFEISRDFHNERLAEADRDGYLVTDGVINKISLEPSPGPACRIWVDRIELYLPETSAAAS